MTTRNRLLLASLLLAGACVDDKATLELRHVCAPPSADTCSFGGECDGIYLGEYVFDASLVTRLTLFIEVRNQRLENDAPDLGQVNTADAFMEQVDITYRGALALSPASHKIQRMIPAAGSSVVTLFPITESAGAEILTALGAGDVADIVADVRVSGQWGDESPYETALYSIPIRVCEGCLFTFGCADPAKPFLVTCPPDLLTGLPIPGGQLPLTATCVAP